MGARISRRSFLAGGVALCALRTIPLVADPKKRLCVGLVSDIHIQDAKRPDLAFFKKALLYFREHAADAVVCGGDLANSGRCEQMELVRDAWNEVFGGDSGRVKRFFIYGNHDVGRWPGNKGKRVIARCPGEFWKECWGDDWAPIFMRQIGGYVFVGVNWGHEKELPEFLEAHRTELEGRRPFFCVQHPHPRGTCHGPHAGGCDTGKSIAALAGFPNAIVLSGHSHWTLTDEMAIWQDGFTSVGLGSLSYVASPRHRHPDTGYENTHIPKVAGDRLYEGNKMMKLVPNSGRQGMVMTVEDDTVIFKRLDFSGEGVSKLGEDWKIRLPIGERPLMSFAIRASKETAPQFEGGVGLIVKRSDEWTRGYGGFNGHAIKEPVKPVRKSAYVFEVPPANASCTRAFELEIVVESESAEVGRRYALVTGYDKPADSAAATKPTVVKLACDMFSGEKLRFKVYPVSALGNKGDPLVSDWVVRKGR